MVDTDLTQVVMADPAVQGFLKTVGAHAQQPEESARMLLQQIDMATRETNSFVGHDGKVIPW
jgi:hypothetical protein